MLEYYFGPESHLPPSRDRAAALLQFVHDVAEHQRTRAKALLHISNAGVENSETDFAELIPKKVSKIAFDVKMRVRTAVDLFGNYLASIIWTCFSQSCFVNLATDPACKRLFNELRGYMILQSSCVMKLIMFSALCKLERNELLGVTLYLSLHRVSSGSLTAKQIDEELLKNLQSSRGKGFLFLEGMMMHRMARGDPVRNYAQRKFQTRRKQSTIHGIDGLLQECEKAKQKNCIARGF